MSSQRAEIIKYKFSTEKIDTRSNTSDLYSRRGLPCPNFGQGMDNPEVFNFIFIPSKLLPQKVVNLISSAFLIRSSSLSTVTQ